MKKNYWLRNQRVNKRHGLFPLCCHTVQKLCIVLAVLQVRRTLTRATKINFASAQQRCAVLQQSREQKAALPVHIASDCQGTALLYCWEHQNVKIIKYCP